MVSFLLVLVTALAHLIDQAQSASAQTQQSFRLSSLSLLEPHVFLPALGCSDSTGLVNNLITGQVASCDPLGETAEPCEHTLNLVAVFDPLVQTPGPGGELAQCISGSEPCNLNFGLFPSCIREGESVSCEEPPSNIIPTNYNNAGVGFSCLGPIAGTVGPNNTGNYIPAVSPVTGPCVVTDVINLRLDLGDDPPITIPLDGAQLAARYSGDPATALINGLARGFLSEATADEIILNFPPFLTNVPFSSLFKGGMGSCPTNDDRDFNPPGDTAGERGWWFYLTFTADPADVPEIVVPTPTATVPLDPTPTATLPQPTETPVPTETPTVPVPACPGDCDGNGEVPIEEVQTAAAIFLDAMPVSACPAADPDGSGGVLIFEVQRVVNSFRLGCP